MHLAFVLYALTPLFLSLRRRSQREHSDFFDMRKLLLHCLGAGAALAAIAGCAQIKKPAAQAKAMPTGLHFDQVGRVALYAGEPCASQIMFDFHGARSTVWLAAPMWETKILTEARIKTSVSMFRENGAVADNRTAATCRSQTRN